MDSRGPNCSSNSGLVFMQSPKSVLLIHSITDLLI